MIMTTHANAEMVFEPGTSGFVRICVEELPGSFDCDPEILAKIPKPPSDHDSES